MSNRKPKSAHYRPDSGKSTRERISHICVTASIIPLFWFGLAVYEFVAMTPSGSDFSIWHLSVLSIGAALAVAGIICTVLGVRSRERRISWRLSWGGVALIAVSLVTVAAVNISLR